MILCKHTPKLKLEIWLSCFCAVDERIQFWVEFHLSQISTFQFPRFSFVKDGIYDTLRQVSSLERLCKSKQKSPGQVDSLDNFFSPKFMGRIIARMLSVKAMENDTVIHTQFNILRACPLISAIKIL